MTKIILYNTPDITWVLNDRNCIRLFTLMDYQLEPNQVKKITFNNFRYVFDKDVVGVPYLTTKDPSSYELYHPEGTLKWSGEKQASIAVKNHTKSIINIPRGLHLCNVSLMTIQYFNLMRKHDGSDRGLSSKLINIEFLYD